MAEKLRLQKAHLFISPQQLSTVWEKEHFFQPDGGGENPNDAESEYVRLSMSGVAFSKRDVNDQSEAGM